MRLKFGLFAAFFFAAAPVVAQEQAAQAPGPQGAIQQAAMAFGECVSAAVQGLDSAIAPEAGATSVLGGCTAQREQLEQAVEAFIATLPDEQKTAAEEQFRLQMAQAETQIATAIRQQRDAAAPATAD